MTVSVFNTVPRQKSRARKRVQTRMRTSTLRQFGGGWNVIDAPVGLSTRFSSVLKNFYRRQDGSQAIRYGTEYKCNIDSAVVNAKPDGTYQETAVGTEQVGDAVADAANFGFMFRPTTASDILKVYIYVDTVNAGSTFTAAVYSDNSGSPGSIIGSASPAVSITTAGRQEFIPVPGTTLATGTDYWIVFTDTGATGDILVDVVANQGGNIASGHSDTITSIADDQFSSSRDLRCLVNMYTVLDGTEIIELAYLGTRLIAFTDEGEAVSIDSSFNIYELWNEGLAQRETGAPNGWSNTFTLITTTEIRGSLVACNGVDKPIEITEDFETRYLQDLANGNNTNVPIAQFCTTVSDYLILAGIEDEESVIYIGSKGTVGVFPGDPAPNDSLSFNLGSYVPTDSNDIRGLSTFRNQLYVHFLSATVKVILGEYDADDNHVPNPDDTLANFGIVAHRCAIPVVNDLLFADVTGVNTIKRNLLSDITEPDRLSELIAPEYQAQVSTIGQANLQDQIFAVHDRLAGKYMLFVPTGVDNNLRAFVLTFNESMKIKAWSEFTGWDWKCATASALGRVYFARDTRIYQYGNGAFSGEDYSGDFKLEFDDQWANMTAYTAGDRIQDTTDNSVWLCLEDHTSAAAGTFEADRDANITYWEEYEGEAIDIDWELPWMDFGTRTKIKRLGFVRYDTQGTAQFTVSVFADNIYLDVNSNYDPALSLSFVGGDSPGYGGGDQPYGGGRRTIDERLWSHPVKGMLFKFRLSGATTKPLRVISISSLYSEGKYGR